MPNDYLEKIDINKSVIYVFVKMKHIFLQALHIIAVGKENVSYVEKFDSNINTFEQIMC